VPLASPIGKQPAIVGFCGKMTEGQTLVLREVKIFGQQELRLDLVTHDVRDGWAVRQLLDSIQCQVPCLAESGEWLREDGYACHRFPSLDENEDAREALFPVTIAPKFLPVDLFDKCERDEGSRDFISHAD
jgi:hypothetical protein